MIPRAFRILLPCPTEAVEQEPAAEASSRCASAATTETEHARLSANTAELWRQLATRLGGM